MQNVTISITNPFDGTLLEMTVESTWKNNCDNYVAKCKDVRITGKFAPTMREEAVSVMLCNLAWEWLRKKRKTLNSAWRNNLRLYETWTEMTNEIKTKLAEK